MEGVVALLAHKCHWESATCYSHDYCTAPRDFTTDRWKIIEQGSSAHICSLLPSLFPPFSHEPTTHSISHYTSDYFVLLLNPSLPLNQLIMIGCPSSSPSISWSISSFFTTFHTTKEKGLESEVSLLLSFRVCFRGNLREIRIQSVATSCQLWK